VATKEQILGLKFKRRRKLGSKSNPRMGLGSRFDGGALFSAWQIEAVGLIYYPLGSNSLPVFLKVKLSLNFKPVVGG